MKRIIHTIALVSLAVGLLNYVGCATKLETGGAYAPGKVVVENGATNIVATAAPDMALFAADSARNLAYATLNAAFETERKNRNFLWSVSPQIKKELDKIRPEAAKAIRDYARARKAYLNNTTPAGLSVLENILGRLQQLSAAADTIITTKPTN